MQSAFYRAIEQAQRALRGADGKAATAHAACDGSLAQLDGRDRWQCGAGCAHCCWHPVGVTVEEAERLAEAILGLESGLRDEWMRRIAREADATAQMTWEELARRPCPLLQDGACSFYEQRPLPCRALASFDRDACARDAAGDRVPIPFDPDAYATGLAVGQALDAATGSHGHRELRGALHAALAQEGAARRAAILAARVAMPPGSAERS